MTTETPASPIHRGSALQTIFLSGLAAGVLDGLDAAIFIGLIRGVPVTAVFQFIASGILGVKAFKGGIATAILGVAVHFFIATALAAIYYSLAVTWRAVVRRPIFSGAGFGLAAFLIMHYVVVPLSATPKQSPASSGDLVNLVASHTLLVGIPIALITRYQLSSSLD